MLHLGHLWTSLALLHRNLRWKRLKIHMRSSGVSIDGVRVLELHSVRSSFRQSGLNKVANYKVLRVLCISNELLYLRGICDSARLFKMRSYLSLCPPPGYLVLSTQFPGCSKESSICLSGSHFPLTWPLYHKVDLAVVPVLEDISSEVSPREPYLFDLWLLTAKQCMELSWLTPERVNTLQCFLSTKQLNNTPPTRTPLTQSDSRRLGQDLNAKLKV